MMNLRLQCSPEVYKRLQNDEEYRNEMTKQLLACRPKTEIVPNIIVTEIPDIKTEVDESFEIKSETWQENNTNSEEVFNNSFQLGQINRKPIKKKYKSKKSQDSKSKRRRRPFIEYVLDSEDIGSTINMTPGMKPEESWRSTKRKKRPNSTDDKILMKLDKIKEKSALLHASVLQRLEKKEKVEQERNELLKKIAASLSEDSDG